MQEYETLRLSEEELTDLMKGVEAFIDEEWPEDVLYIIRPSKHDYDKISAMRNWLIWLRGDIDRVYRNGIEISPDFGTVPLIPKYAAEGVEVPSEIKLQNEIQKYNFYEVRVNFYSKPEEHVLLKNVNLKLKIDDDSDKADRETVVISMVPDNTYKNILKSNTTAKIAFTADAKAKAEIPPFKLNFGEVDLNTSITADIDSSVDLTLPEIAINKTLISAVGISDTECSWVFDEVQSDEDVQVLVILKVPQEATEVKITAFLEVTPYKDEWAPLSDTKLKVIRTSREKKIDLRT